MRKSYFILAIVLTACGGRQPPAWDAVAAREKHPWGYYSGQVEARWENDGRHMFSHPIGETAQLGLRLMMSLDALTEGGRGYPLLFQSGETWHDQPLHDSERI